MLGISLQDSYQLLEVGLEEGGLSKIVSIA
jgi:hypothetical protein